MRRTTVRNGVLDALQFDQIAGMRICTSTTHMRWEGMSYFPTILDFKSAALIMLVVITWSKYPKDRHYDYFPPLKHQNIVKST